MTHVRRTSMTLGAVLLVALTAIALLQPRAAAAQTVFSAPRIVSISPATGTSAGGTVVTVTGTGFANGAIMDLSGLPMSNVVVVSSTQITATTPRSTPGAANIRVINPDGGAFTFSGGFFYTDPTSALSVSTAFPTTGSNAGGTTVSVTGTGFSSGSLVFFGGVPARGVTYQGPSLLSVQAPPNTTGTVPVVVRNPDGVTVTLANAFTYTGGVQVTNVRPGAGPAAGGTRLLITGNGFTPGASVTVGTAAATGLIVVNSTQIIATTPAGTSGDATVTVTNPAGGSANMPSGFRYAGASTPATAPALSSVFPTSSSTAGGAAISVFGVNLSGGATILFGGVPSPSVQWNGPSSITATAPSSSPGPVSVTIINSDGQTATLPNAFTFEGPSGLTASQVSPATGPAAGGTTVTITGTGFPSGAWVTFGDTVAPTTTVVGTNQIVAVSPAGSGTATVTVNALGGLTAVIPGGFAYTGDAPATPTTPTTPAGTTGPGTFAAAPVFSSGDSKLAQAVFNGGSFAQLDTALTANNARGAWAQTPTGAFVLYIVGAPSFVNAPIVSAFPTGFPGVVALTLVGK